MIRRQIVLPASPERVWEALTDADQVAGWFGGRLELDVCEGGDVQYLDEGGARVGQVDAVRYGQMLRFRWWSSPEGDAESEVTYLLEPVEDGESTRLTVSERATGAGASGAGASGSGSLRAGASGAGAAQWSIWDSRLLGVWACLAVPAFALAGCVVAGGARS